MGKHSAAPTPVAQPRTIHWWRRILVLFLVLSALASVVGLWFIRPTAQPRVAPEFYTTFGLSQPQVDATVTAIYPGACTSAEMGKAIDDSPRVSPAEAKDCTWIIARIADNSPNDPGKHTLLIHSGQLGEPQLEEGEGIRLIRSTAADGTTNYSFGDLQRGTSLLWWLIGVGAAVLLCAAWRGLRAIVGLLISLAVVITLVIPSILIGTSPILVATVCGALILFLVVFLVHGLNWKAASALCGSLIALGLAAILAHVAISNNNIRGLGDENNLHIILYLPDVSVTGLMLCGFIIGTLGVLNDIAIAQASTVNELSKLNPYASPWQLFRSAMKVGQDHISSMVYTLVLTYTGASLPLLLLLRMSDRPILQTLSSDIVATELLRSGIGAIALTLTVPITTIIAAYAVVEREAHAVEAEA